MGMWKEVCVEELSTVCFHCFSYTIFIPLTLFSGITRKRPLRNRESDQSKSTAWFRSEMIDIISRVLFLFFFLQHINDTLSQAERLSAEANCWIFLGGQHPNANAPFLHYTSSKLRADALQEATALANTFGDITYGLTQVRRHEAMDIAKKYSEARRDAADARAGEQEARRLLAEKEKEAVILNALLASHRQPGFISQSSIVAGSLPNM